MEKAMPTAVGSVLTFRLTQRVIEDEMTFVLTITDDVMFPREATIVIPEADIEQARDFLTEAKNLCLVGRISEGVQEED